MKASKEFVSILSVVFIAVLSFITVQPAVAFDGAVVTIQDNSTGGDCTTYGKWNAKTKTCKLTMDINLGSVSAGIGIISDGITLLCNGHSITGNTNGTGIEVIGRTGVTIKNCNVHDLFYGIFLQDSNSNTVKDNTANSNCRGIEIQTSNSNNVSNNTANNNAIACNLPTGIVLTGSDSNTVNNNTANSNVLGIALDGSDSNTVNNNTANSNFAGILLFDANSNTVNLNTADGNDGYGFSNDNSSTGNTYKNNECSGNGLGGSDPAGLTGLCSPQP